jgi:hypothetical protein
MQGCLALPPKAHFVAVAVWTLGGRAKHDLIILVFQVESECESFKQDSNMRRSFPKIYY